MNKNILKKFIEDYFKLNNVNFELKNKIYTIHFKERLANKLGKERKFSFSREIADDYGVEYISLKNDLVRFLLRDSTNNGQLIKAKLDTSILGKQKLNLDDNILIKKRTINKETAIAFLFKVSSTNTISESNPEFLKYEVVSYNDCHIFPSKIIEEFHNFEFADISFSFNANNVTKTHTVAYENLNKFLEFKYGEHEIANEEYYENRIKELKIRHENVVKDCRLKEKEKGEKILQLDYRIDSARTYETEKRYNEDLKKAKKNLRFIQENNKKEINEDFIRTEHRIKQEKEKYDFEVKVYLLSAMIFQYDVENIILKSKLTNEETNIKYNQLINEIYGYECPICKNNSNGVIISLDGHFCCTKCATSYPEKKTYLCKKDNVVKCIISGDLIPKTKIYQCESCHQYFNKEYLKKDVLGKRVCGLCSKKLYDGELINKDDAIFSKKYKSYFRPSEVKKCQFSKDYLPIKDLIQTKGSHKLISKEFIKKCKITGLTFSPDEIDSKEISNFVKELKEINTNKIKYKKLVEKISRNKVEMTENKYWVFVKIKSILRNKYLLYDKKKNKIID